MKQNPNTEIDLQDAGDVIQQRFRYQNTYAAIVSCSLLLNAGVAEVYCEHHEDVLVKFKDGLFEGIQVKTKDTNFPGFTFSDEAIQKAILKFIKLDLKYPGLFKSFRIVTNNGMAKIKNDNLEIIVNTARSGNRKELLKNRSKTNKFINAACKKLKCTQDDVVRTISKIILRPDFANLNDIKKSLVYELERLPDLGNQTLGMLSEIADQLILRSYNASSKGEEKICEAFLIGQSFEESKNNAILENKTITVDQVSEIINKCLQHPASHFLKDDSSLLSKAQGSKILEKKLDAGGISSLNVNLLKDQKYSFETYISQQIYKLGVEKISPRYNQLQLIINTICQETYDIIASPDKLFGQEMLNEVRVRIKERMLNERANFSDFQYEHSLGMAATLTEDCRVWWSNHFNINA